jgi:iron(III) transport system ATP-binding protein
MTNSASLSVSGLTKRFGAKGEVAALDGVDLEFPAGQCTVLLGPSGCGKTTVLRSIAGLIAPDTGTIAIGGETVFDAARGLEVPPEARRLGMVFQSYALWPHMSVARNIAYPLRGLGKEETAGKVDAMLDWVGLPGMGGRYVHELSGGQQQRVSLARAMVASPRAILFDEPLSNLDARLRERMRLELLALRQKSPFTSIYVTHDLLEAMTLGDRVAVMRAGRVEQQGPPEEVYRRPRTRFAAEFVGIPNLIEGVVRGVEGDHTILETQLGLLRARGWKSAAAGDKRTVALRPSLLRLTQGGSARVLRAAFQGSGCLVALDLGGAEIAVEIAGESRPEAGIAVAISPVDGAVFPMLDD